MGAGKLPAFFVKVGHVKYSNLRGVQHSSMKMYKRGFYFQQPLFSTIVTYPDEQGSHHPSFIP
jgi:hypothetical protein